MRKIQVQIIGDSELLMNSPKHMIDEIGNKNKSRLKERDIEKEAEKLAYRTKNKKLYVPACAIRGCLINSGKWKKFGKFSLRPLLAAATRIEPEEVILDKQKYSIDLRTVVIQRARIVKARPKIEKGWKLNFDIIYNDDLINPDIIKQCLEEGGKICGLLDFRMEKLGSFGAYHISKWKVKD